MTPLTQMSLSRRAGPSTTHLYEYGAPVSALFLNDGSVPDTRHTYRGGRAAVVETSPALGSHDAPKPRDYRTGPRRSSFHAFPDRTSSPSPGQSIPRPNTISRWTIRPYFAAEAFARRSSNAGFGCEALRGRSTRLPPAFRS